jgi:hypothetical protein
VSEHTVKALDELISNPQNVAQAGGLPRALLSLVPATADERKSFCSRVVDQLYSQRPILRDGQTVGRPAKPSLGWHFNDLAFGILDRKTMVFFNLFPYFAR